MSELTLEMSSEKLPTIIVETPLGSQTLVNSSLDEAMSRVSSDLKKMYDSNFYQSIDVHYGVRSKMGDSLKQRMLKRRKQVMEYKIELEKQYLQQIAAVNNQAELENVDKYYNTHLQIINSREKEFDMGEFDPIIFVQAKKKRPLFGKIFQEFDRKGVAMLKATIGYRAPFSIFDRLQLNIETPPIAYFKKRTYYQFGFNWSNPITAFSGSNFFLSGTNSCTPLFRGVDEKRRSGSVGIQKDDLRIQYEMVRRYPRLHERIAQYCALGYGRPSTKHSIKLSKTITDTLNRGEIMTGELEQGKIECSVPVLSEAVFAKAEYSYRRMYDIFGWSQHLGNPFLKMLVQNSNLETNFSFKAISMQKSIVSDYLENIEIRGFDNDRRPRESVLQTKGSIKFNNYNYPFLKTIGVTPYIYGQAGLSLSSNVRDPYVLGSVGTGLSFSLGKSLQLELLYCLFQAQNKPIREPVNFQIRLGLID